GDGAAAASALGSAQFDAVVDFIAFTPADIERRIELLGSRTRQYVFISSASVYQKPPAHPVITESTPLANPYWEYSRNKIACEERLLRAYREQSFPITIVRPSHTYDTVIPVAVGNWNYTIADRMRRGKPIVVHGDGTSLWTVTHSNDFAVGLLGLLGNPAALGNAFHITSDELLTWNQLYQTVGLALGVDPLLVHIPSQLIARVDPPTGAGLLGDKAHSVIFDNTKIKRLVPEYCAKIRFSQGIRRTLEWFHADAERQRVDEHSNQVIDAILALWNRLSG
ncbi:MAG TPA: NAD-dependent epimerase/dehydratase family protein, partial [Polyangiaceae bacterium]